MDAYHTYESRLELGCCHYQDLPVLDKKLQSCLSGLGKTIFGPVEHHGIRSTIYHTEGITAYLRVNPLKEGEIHIIDVHLYSELTPTSKLEEKLSQLAKSHKIERQPRVSAVGSGFDHVVG